MSERTYTVTHEQLVGLRAAGRALNEIAEKVAVIEESIVEVVGGVLDANTVDESEAMSVWESLIVEARAASDA